MPSRDNIIDNVEHYSAKELQDFINQGILTFEELCQETEGYLPVDVRKELEELLNGTPDDRESTSPYYEYPTPNPDLPQEPPVYEPPIDDWTRVDKTSIEALREFISTHPGHPMVAEANKIINDLFLDNWEVRNIDTLKTDINDVMTNKNVLDKGAKIVDTIKEYFEQEYITPKQFLSLLAEDNNLVSAFIVKSLIDMGYFTYPDLISFGFNEMFIHQLIKGIDNTEFFYPQPIDRINKVGTEIYFWGIPSSGKTCALGGILSMANNGNVCVNMSPDPDCQGYGYMTRLAGIFKEDHNVGTLPPGTPVYAIYEMGFELEDREGKVHPIICVDLAGELIRCMYKSDAGEPLSDEERETLQSVTNLLISNRTTNRKMHFFVLEYGGEERMYEGLGQTAYLEAALAYINRTKIFDKETDGIFLLFTKVDKAKLRGGELVEHLKEYTERYYSNFYNGLVSICKRAEINGGKVERLPFTLGNVCFQNYCMFDGAASENVVQKIINRSKGFKRGKLQKFINKVKQ